MALSPEVIDLLICCAGVDPQKGRKLEALIAKGVDWSLVVEQGRRHEILPLVYWTLKHQCPDKVPTPIMKELADFFQGNARKNLFAIGELLRILNRLEEMGISAIPFKGPVLTFNLYGNPGLRCYGDLDILIHPEDFRRTIQTMGNLGYRPVEPIHSPPQETVLLNSAYEYGYFHPALGTQVDIHWGIYLDWIYEPGQVKTWWKHLEGTFLGNRPVFTLSSEDTLLLLAAHGSLHGWSSLKWVSDIAQLIQTREIDWHYVFDQAEEKKCVRMTRTGILLANKMLRAPIPEPVRNLSKKDKTAINLAWKASGQIVSGKKLGLIGNQIPMLLSHDHCLDRLRYLVWVALTPRIKDVMVFNLPVRLAFLYYLIRPFRLLLTYILKNKKKSSLAEQTLSI